MCASYGLKGSPYHESELPFTTFSDQASLARLNQWVRERGGRAAITGRNALNLNPIIREIDGERTLDLAWWWIWYDNSGPVKFSAFNSRDDKLLRSWKRPFQHRALLPASWYVEKKQRFELPTGEPFGIAAITSTITRDDGSLLTTYSMVTRDAPAGSEAANVWHRMPLILPQDMHDEWLSDRPGDESLVAEIQHASHGISEAMTTTVQPTLI